MSRFLEDFAELIKTNKGGMNGHNLLVIPCANRVVAWRGYDIYPGVPDLTRFAAEYNG